IGSSVRGGFSAGRCGRGVLPVVRADANDSEQVVRLESFLRNMRERKRMKRIFRENYNGNNLPVWKSINIFAQNFLFQTQLFINAYD
ncbi:MAG: hypothetical protein K2H69_01990, partial [Alistipes sp.]|nr:hypothetical protein [Alistipes sp.]